MALANRRARANFKNRERGNANKHPSEHELEGGAPPRDEHRQAKPPRAKPAAKKAAPKKRAAKKRRR